jgi:predicted dehydrogenase
MEIIRIGVIGAGKHARANIFPSLKLLQQPVACVCSQHLDRAESAAREFQAGRAYRDYSEMIEKENWMPSSLPPACSMPGSSKTA